MSELWTPGSWKLEAGRSIATPSGTFFLTYGKDRNGNPHFRNFCELDTIAREIVALPELIASCEAFASAWDRCLQLEKTDVAIRMVREARAKAKGLL